MQSRLHGPLLVFALLAMALFIVIGLGAAAIAILANKAILPNESKMLTATSQVGHFSIQYPEGMFFSEAPWRGIEREPDPTTLVAILNTPQIQKYGTIVEIRRGHDAPIALTEVVKWGEQINKLRDGYTLISIGPMDVNGETTIIAEFTAQEYFTAPFAGNRSIHCLDNFRVHKQGVIIDFCTDSDDFARLKPTFTKMVERFAYLD